MTTRFYYEDDQGRMVDEQGNDAMNFVEEVTPFHLKNFNSYKSIAKSKKMNSYRFKRAKNS